MVKNTKIRFLEKIGSFNDLYVAVRFYVGSYVITLIFFVTCSKKVYLMSILFLKSIECCPAEIFNFLSEKFESAAGI